MASDIPYLPSVFITGGQTGADSIPLGVYEEFGIKLDGYMPKGFARSDGDGAEIAARHGLREGEGGHSWRDRKNVELADAVCAFLTTKPETGRGTMQTCAYALSGKYRHVQLDKPRDSDFVILKPASAGIPVLVFWNVTDDNVDACASILRSFLGEHKPQALMFSGPLERTWPGIERVGVQILRSSLWCSSQATGTALAVLKGSTAEASADLEASPESGVRSARSCELSVKQTRRWKVRT